MHRSIRGIGLMLAAATALATAQVQAASLGTEVLRGAAYGFAVKQAAKPLNSFINTVTLRHGMSSNVATKVVPILSVGEKGYVGGAQVAGPRTLVDKVHAVFQYEKNFDDNNYRAKVLVPSASLNPLKLSRVQKVGITALIDVSLDGELRTHSVGTGIQTGDAIRGVAVLAAVKVAGSGINKVINTITLNKSDATKVVPLGSFGEKAYLGGAQVAAPKSDVGKVKAVWTYEDLFSSGRFRVRVMLPVSALNPLQMKRVNSAGVTAVIDMALSQQESVPEDEAPRWWGDYRRGDNVWRDDYRRGEGSWRDENRRSDEPSYQHDNGLHKGWWKGKRNGRKNEKVDEKWRERLNLFGR